VAIVVGGFVLATRADDPNEQIPADTPVAPDPATAAEEIARGFLAAENAYDADRALIYLSAEALGAEWGSAEHYRRRPRHTRRSAPRRPARAGHRIDLTTPSRTRSQRQTKPPTERNTHHGTSSTPCGRVSRTPDRCRARGDTAPRTALM
jgi:hypothetical protein